MALFVLGYRVENRALVKSRSMARCQVPGIKCHVFKIEQKASQLWRLTNLLIKVRNGPLTHKDVKNEESPG